MAESVPKPVRRTQASKYFEDPRLSRADGSAVCKSGLATHHPSPSLGEIEK